MREREREEVWERAREEGERDCASTQEEDRIIGGRKSKGGERERDSQVTSRPLFLPRDVNQNSPCLKPLGVSRTMYDYI